MRGLTPSRAGAGLVAQGGGAVLALLLSTGCGRIGYDLLPSLGTGGEAGGSAGDAGDRAPLDASAGGTGSTGDASMGGGGSPGTGGSLGTGGASGAGGAIVTGGAPGTDGAHATGGAAGAGGAQQDASSCHLVPLSLADWCTQIPELATPPVVDGVLDCPLELRTMPVQGWTAAGTPDAAAPDAAAEYAVAWDASGLYLYIQVHDPLVVPAASTDPLWTGDAVEIFVDSDGSYSAPPAFDDPGSRQFIVAAPSGATPSQRGVYYTQGTVLGGDWTSTQYAAYPTSDGYVVEAVVAAADLGLATWTPVQFGAVGFDLAIDVSYPTASQTGPEGHRLGQYFLRVTPGTLTLPYRDVAAFCNPTTIPR